MASARLKKNKNQNANQFLSPEQSRTMKPADFKNHSKLKDLSHDELIELLCLMEAELQAKDILLKAILSGQADTAMPLSHLMNDGHFATLPVERENGEEEDEVWLGEPSAHLNHVVAYHQVVREQMQSILGSLRTQHKQTVNQLDDERHRHALDTAQGDDVTYMLEKERERLQHEVDMEQAKRRKVEKERDKLIKVVEEDRSDQMNAFNDLLNDCKVLGFQLSQNKCRTDQMQKDIDKEKQKNKVLSELMVEETRKFKERLKLYEDEVRDYHLIDQKRSDLEERLRDSEAMFKETHQLLTEEQKKNKLMARDMNRLQNQLLNNDYVENDICDDAALVLPQSQTATTAKQANVSKIALSKLERESPEPTTVAPQDVQLDRYRVATVQKSNTVKQAGKAAVQSRMSIVPRALPGHVVPAQDRIDGAHKRNSYEEPKRNSYEDSRNQHYHNRNSYEGHNSPSQLYINSNTLQTRKYNSNEEVSNVESMDMTPKRNSYEGDSDSKRAPPPAPPRRVSSLTSPDRGPVVKVSAQQIQAHKSASLQQAPQSYLIRSSHSNSSDALPVMVVVTCSYGWEYKAGEGLVEGEHFIDLLSIVHVKLDSDWKEFTQLIQHAYVNECKGKIADGPDITVDSILLYEYAGVIWSDDDVEEIEEDLQDVLAEEFQQQHQSVVFLRLKVEEGCLDDLSYACLVSTQTLQECLRIVYQEKNILLTANEELEGCHFASCLSNWMKVKEEGVSSHCDIIRLETDDFGDIDDVINLLLANGILHKSNALPSKRNAILILNIDLLEEKNCTTEIYQWLSMRAEVKKNGRTPSNSNSYMLHDDVIVIAYVTHARVTSLTQCTYRVFKILSLPFVLPSLVHRWLRQKIVGYPPYFVQERMMCEFSKWLSDVFYMLYRSFFKLEMLAKLPDARVYLDAPLEDPGRMTSWMKELWSNHITPCVEESVRHRAQAAPDTQRDILIKVTLKAVFDKSIRPGCPIELAI